MILTNMTYFGLQKIYFLTIIFYFSGMCLGKTFFDRHYYLCDLVTTVCLSACICALYSIGAVGFNMYIQICHPVIYQTMFSFYSTLFFCLLIWIFGALVCIGPLFGWSMNVYDEKVLECFWSRTHSFSFTLFFSAAIVFVPVFIISFSFIRIFLHVRASKQRLKNNKSKNDRTISSGVTHLASTLSIIFLVFIICWLPYSLIIVLDFDDSLPMEVYLYTLLLAHMHSTLNCFVYYLTNPHFQQGYQLVLQTLTCKWYKPNKVHST